MANLDWSQCPAVESVQSRLGGAWVFRDTRLPVATVIENLEDLSVEEVIEQFDVTREQIRAVLDFVAQSLKAPEPPVFVPRDAHPLLITAPRAALGGHLRRRRLLRPTRRAGTG